MFCSHCGGKNPDNVAFCGHCGASLQVAPVAGRKRPRWLIWGSMGGVLLCLLCSLLYWSMLIPIPLLPKATAGSGIIQRLRITQENLPRPSSFDGFILKPVEDTLVQDVQTNGHGEIILPPICGAKADFEVANVSETHIFTFVGQFGTGPLIYAMRNVGESLAKSRYGYHVQWAVYQNGKRTVIEDNHWFACVLGQEQLTCTGPDWRKYDSAEMCIYYEDPACRVPVQCFNFGGDNPFPIEGQLACDLPPAFNLLQVTPGVNNGAAYVFGTNGVVVPSGKYFLKVTLDTGDSSLGYCQFLDGALRCGGYDPARLKVVKWELVQEPMDICVDPVAAGDFGAPAAAQDNGAAVACDANFTCGQGASMELAGANDAGNSVYVVTCPKLDNAYIPILKSCVFVGGVNCAEKGPVIQADYQVGFGNSTGWNCRYFPPSDPKLLCEGPPQDLNNPVTSANLFLAQQGCNNVAILEQSFASAAQPVPQPAPQNQNNRCSLFDNMKMSVVYMDWTPGAPLTFYLKMPGGIPGLENDIAGDMDEWTYIAKIGEYKSSACIYQGYKERLYCSVSLPSSYSNSIRSMTLSINGCDVPIFSDQTADLPGIEGNPPAANQPNGNETVSGCGSAPSNTSSGDYISWCSCVGGVYDSYSSSCSLESGSNTSPSGPTCSSGLDSSACAAAGGTYTTMPGFCDPGPCPSHCSCP